MSFLYCRVENTHAVYFTDASDDWKKLNFIQYVTYLHQEFTTF